MFLILSQFYQIINFKRRMNLSGRMNLQNTKDYTSKLNDVIVTCRNNQLECDNLIRGERGLIAGWKSLPIVNIQQMLASFRAI